MKSNLGFFVFLPHKKHLITVGLGIHDGLEFGLGDL